ncbi:hypothetical protein A2Y85_01105 [candidate division WOR-3 bacterium RBG_13_43_14]|uniref:ABC transporter permease n=1 Tax=candidate division WOR-3 bacterium RBG_13_43_14 TaxID=1802590 RepID=A0A1F4UFU2_UNCW3|nr:MAG: hypothetical protein A2Y85_01105 [candidate division WOR-3 bacterium RBG_13_43_14]
MNLFLVAFRNLTRRKVRTTITVFSIGVAIAVLFTVLSFNRGYEQSLRNQIQRMGIHLMVIPIGCPYEAASLILKGGQIDNYLPASAADAVRSMEAVEIAAPVLMHGIVKPEEGRTDIYLGVDEEIIKLKNWWKINGDFLKGENDIVLGYDVSLIELSNVGDQIYLPEFDHTFDVVGILEQTGTEDDGFFFIKLETAQGLFSKESLLTSIQIRLKDPGMAAAIAKKLEELPQVEVITMSELLGTMLSLVGSVQTIVLSIVIVVVAIVSFGVLNTILMSVFERLKELGIMMATGAGRIHIFVLVWLESLILSIIGGIAGLLIALVAGRIIEKLLNRILPLAPATGIVNFQASTFVYCLIIALIIGTVAGIYPAILAAQQKPVKVLRSA